MGTVKSVSEYYLLCTCARNNVVRKFIDSTATEYISIDEWLLFVQAME